MEFLESEQAQDRRRQLPPILHPPPNSPTAHSTPHTCPARFGACGTRAGARSLSPAFQHLTLHPPHPAHPTPTLHVVVQAEGELARAKAVGGVAPRRQRLVLLALVQVDLAGIVQLNGARCVKRLVDAVDVRCGIGRLVQVATFMLFKRRGRNDDVLRKCEWPGSLQV
eukprot:366491-Chlamydomonas_euryale.AAC.1